MRYSFGRGRPELQCEKIKKNGEQCRAVRCTGQKYCNRHGGGVAVKAAREAGRIWRFTSWKFYKAGLSDPLLGMVGPAVRLTLGEAWLAAQHHGDPRIYTNTRRAVARRYVSRLVACGKTDILDELGIEYYAKMQR